MATMEQKPMDIAYENQAVPGIKEAIKQAGWGDAERWGSFGGKFSDYFTMLARSAEGGPVKAACTAVLWMNFMNLVDEETGSREAVNVFIKPIAEALASKMEQGDAGSLQSCEIARLSNVAGETARNATWLAEENRAPVRALATAATHQWLRMYNEEKMQIADHVKAAAPSRTKSAKRLFG